MSSLIEVGGSLDIINNNALTVLSLSLLGSVDGSFKVYSNPALTALDVSMLRVANGCQIMDNPLLVSLDLRRLAQVKGIFQVTSNNEAVNITLPCAAKAIVKLRPAGAVSYWNEHPTICHASTTMVGNDGTCGECLEYTDNSGCGESAACVQCDAPTAGNWSWTRRDNLYCTLDQVMATHPTEAEAKAACLADESCSAIEDKRCDLSLSWNTCRSTELYIRGILGADACVHRPKPAITPPLPPTALPGFVWFDADEPSTANHVYPCSKARCDAAIVCRCPFAQAACDFASDLVDASGAARMPACTPNDAGALDAAFFVYDNSVVNTIVLTGITSIGSITVVACPNLQNISALTATAAGNVTVQSCSGLTGISMPMLSTASFVNVAMCPALGLLDVGSITTIGGDVSIGGCGALPAIHLSALETVGGSLSVSAADMVSLVHLDHLGAVGGSFSIAGVATNAVTTLPCSARGKSWESTSVGTVKYSTGLEIACHAGSLVQVSGTTCDVCDVCVSCDDATSAPVLLTDFVQFVGSTSERGGSSAALIFECESGSGCHSANSTRSAICMSDLYEGHFCQSCASGFRHSQDGADGYECVRCDEEAVLTSVVVVLVAGVIIAATTAAAMNARKRITEAEAFAFDAVVRSLVLPVKTLIGYAQVNSQLRSVLNVRFPAIFTALMEQLLSMLRISDLLIDSECAGMSSFFNKWLKDVVIQPCVLLAIVFIYFIVKRQATDSAEARRDVAGNVFFVVFFCCEYSHPAGPCTFSFGRFDLTCRMLPCC